MLTDPAKLRRRILLAVTGLSPQVVTETLYALAMERAGACLPTEVRLLTTTEGAERARLTLLSDEPGWFHRLRSEYSLPEIAFDAKRIHVLTGPDGAALDDIRTPEANAWAADLVTEQVRAATEDPESALHVSIAGGRKTLGFYAGYALSLYGRPQDRLSHVLVSTPFESHPGFFYPSRESRVIYTQPPDSRPLDTREARVTLAEIPFVRLREGLPTRLQRGQSSYTRTVAAAQRALEPPQLIIDLAGRCIHAGGERVDMAPADLAFYSLMARRRKGGMHPARRDDRDLAGPLLAEYGRIVPEMSGTMERIEDTLAEGMTAKYFDERKSKTNRALTDALGAALARVYLIHPDGRRAGRFTLRIEPDAIRYGRPPETHETAL